MYVIRHHDDCIDGDVREMQWNIAPIPVGGLTDIRQHHMSVMNVTEMVFSTVRDNRHEIRAGGGVIIFA